jgi:predicted ribosomally synthesized peptide with nif11-like leader
VNEKNVIRFIDYLTKNKESREKVKALGEDYTAIAAYGRTLGYEFTPNEIKDSMANTQQAIKSKWQNAATKQQLSNGAKQFITFSNLADTDAEIAKRIAELSKNPQGLIAYGKEKGYDFNEKDIKEVANKLLEQEDELSDEELEMVAGGTTALFIIMLVGGVGALSAGAAAAVGTVGVLGSVAAISMLVAD